MADAPDLEAVLRPHAGRPVHFDPLPGGNHGDAVITAGSRALHTKVGLDLVDDPSTAELILVRGNGVLTDFYAHTPHRARIQGHLDRHPQTAFVLEPSTFFVTGSPTLSTADRRAPTFLFARDRESYRMEAAKSHGPDVHLAVDHDMAMHLAGSPWLEELQGRSADAHALVVERHDIENPRYGLRHSRARRRLSRMTPTGLKRRLRPMVARARTAAPTPFSADAARVLRATGAEGPLVRGDVSNPALYTWEQFLDAVVRAHTVVTQRLHVGMLAALLGKQTWLDDRGYHKIRGIWDLSLRDLPNVHLMSTLDDDHGGTR